jgi:hypothetical protein
VEKLHHQPGKAFECSGNADRRRHLDQHAFSRLYVDLKLASFVDG